MPAEGRELSSRRATVSALASGHLRIHRTFWLSNALAIVGIIAVAWHAFGSVATQLGHRGDSWSYIVRIGEQGPWSIIETQGGRPALPVAWALGFAIAGTSPWIYHLMSFVFITLAALCLYSIVVILLPGETFLGAAIGALSVLWPADPTRYDAATLGNRQALALTMAGFLCLALAFRKDNRWWLVWGTVALTVGMLTYEAQLPLLLLPLALAVRVRHRRGKALRYVAVTVVPALAWVLANAAAIYLARPRRVYQTALPVDLSVLKAFRRLLEGSEVLFLDAIRTPFALVRSGNVPDVSAVWFATALFSIWILLIGVAAPRPSGFTAARTYLAGAGTGAVWSVLGAAIFVLLPIPMTQPDRVHTFTMTGAAITVACVVWSAGTLLGRFRMLGQVIACTAIASLFFAMVAVYQRNYRQTWHEQTLVLDAIARQAPDIRLGSLVIIANLPDTRLVFLSGYTCEFALIHVLGHPSVTLSWLDGSDASIGEMIASQRVNCGLLFNGLEYLDSGVRVTTVVHGVDYQFPPFRKTFPYEQILVFSFQEGNGAQLLDEFPRALAPSTADLRGYNPRSLILDAPRRANASVLTNAD